jgi:hypothetical protein
MGRATAQRNISKRRAHVSQIAWAWHSPCSLARSLQQRHNASITRLMTRKRSVTWWSIGAVVLLAAFLRLMVLCFDSAATRDMPNPAVLPVRPDLFVVGEDGLSVSAVYDVKDSVPMDAVRQVATKYPYVQELSLQGYKIGDGSGFEHLEKLPGLKVLDLEDSGITDTTLDLLRPLIQLRRLNVAGTEISDHGLHNLSGMTSLEALDVHNTSISDAGAYKIADLQSLRSLNVSRTRITDKGIVALVSLQHLRHLDLAATAVSDTGVAAICRGCQLESLSISYTKITDGSLPVLVAMESLRELEIVDTSITDEGTEMLRKRRPTMRVWTIPSDLRGIE